MDVSGLECPQCHARKTEYLSTTNEWIFYCPVCDSRFNRQNEIMPKQGG